MMFRTIIVLTSMFQLCYGSAIDWCEYWRQLEKDVVRPECITASSDVQQVNLENVQFARNPEFSSCPEFEIISCKECEQQCNQPAPHCSQDECSIQCVCQPGFARDANGACIPVESCQRPNLGIYRMVPSLVRGVIKMIAIAQNPEFQAHQ